MNLTSQKQVSKMTLRNWKVTYEKIFQLCESIKEELNKMNEETEKDNLTENNYYFGQQTMFMIRLKCMCVVRIENVIFCCCCLL